MPGTEKSSKVWCDGCYDLMHVGHSNSLRQAKMLGNYLIVGVHTDEEIACHKGPPVFTFDERCKMIASIKWVDEIVKGAPYITTLAVLDQHGCAICCHGEDISLTDNGVDTYHEIKNAGRYRGIHRTEGISTTALVQRVLRIEDQDERVYKSPWTGSGSFLLTARKLAEFGAISPPKVTDRVVYVTGGFDLYHVGHVAFLQKARDLGQYLIVGLYSDQTIKQHKGLNYPIMTMQERLLNLLACKYVSDVVIDAPFAVSKEVMDALGVDLVADGYYHTKDQTSFEDPYKYPRENNRFVHVDSGSEITTKKIIDRIIKNKLDYIERNERKERKELDLINFKRQD